MRESVTDEAASSAGPGIVQEVAAEIRWSFTRPWVWLRGLALNLVFSLAYLVVVPLSGHHRGAWGVVVGSYFVNFILAAVTTTNMFGSSRVRTLARLHNGESLRRLLLVKNLTLLLIVGAPTLVLTAVLTEDEASHSLALTVPAVAFPLLCWIAFGNVVSVLLPIRAVSLRKRWRHGRYRASTGLWLAHLAVPYGLFVLIQYLRRAEHRLDVDLPPALRATPGVHALGLVISGTAI